MLRLAVILPWVMGLTLLLAGCQPKKTELVIKPQQQTPLRGLAKPPATSAELMALVAQARTAEDPEEVLQGLDRYIQQHDPVLRDEARFRKAQVMLELHLPGAYREVQTVLEDLPDYPLVPYAYFWIAQWWVYQDEPGRALAMLTKVLEHPALTQELAEKVLQSGPAISKQVPETEAVAWMLSAARLDEGGRSQWLRSAARRASAETLRQLNRMPGEDVRLVAEMDMHAARQYLLSGDMVMVRQIDDWLRQLAAGSEFQRRVEQWAAGRSRAAVIGVLLPLTGPQARYGEAALRGMRMAMSAMGEDGRITLRIEDTASDAQTCIDAYRRLEAESVDMVIGPLLASSARALLPHIHAKTPVLSMTSAVDLAEKSDAFFVHTLAPAVQVQYIAAYAIEHGARRVAVIRGNHASMQQEAERFRDAFSAMGGEVVDELVLPEDQLDVRELLRELKMRTDDEVLLAELDEDAAVLMPEYDLEVRMPSRLDAIYLALPGRRVALLASQLAYSDLTGMALYGSSRWKDGHLLDDRGHYLSRARFVSQARDENQQGRLQAVQFMYRETWGSSRPGQLTLLAYDTLQIAAVMASRLGLYGRQIAAALQDEAGFPALTGDVSFDANGVGQKRLDMYMIRKGNIVPAS